MAVKSGFFTSQNGDRKYTAEDFNTFLSGLVGNGVFQGVEGGLQVIAATGNSILVKPGKGTINGSWLLNESNYAIDLGQSEIALNRIDSVLMIYDKTNRVVRLGYAKGTPAASPAAPALTRTENVQWYRLANVYRAAGSTDVKTANITDTRASGDCGWVTGLIKQVDTSTLYDQWAAAYKEYYDSTKAFFDGLKTSIKQDFDTLYSTTETEVEELKSGIRAKMDEYYDEFERWFETVKDQVGSATLVKSFVSSYTTTKTESVIPLNLPNYVAGLDTLAVYVNGMRLIPGKDYAPNGTASITLTLPLEAGQQVVFESLKSVEEKREVVMRSKEKAQCTYITSGESCS